MRAGERRGMGGQRKREKEGEECKGWGTEREGGERERERCTYMYTTTIIDKRIMYTFMWAVYWLTWFYFM